MSAHGTIARYNEGCRCSDCKEASRDSTRRRRVREAAGLDPTPGVELDERIQHELAEQLRQQRIAAGLIRVAEERPAWYDDAACKGKTDLFFGPVQERPEPRSWRERDAEAICATCPARVECRALGRRGLEFGTWGGEHELGRATAGRGPGLSTRRDVVEAAREAREIQEARG